MTLFTHPLRQAMYLTTFGLLVAGPLQAEQAHYRIDLPAQPLDQSINALARQTGTRIVFNTDAAHAIQAPALHQQSSVEQALRQLLAGSQLSLSQAADGQYLITLPSEPSNGALELDTSSVIGRQPVTTTEGSHSYTSGAVTLGKGVQTLKDIPQSVTVMTRQQMDDQNTQTISDLVNRTPGLTAARSPGSGLFIYSRGFSIDTLQYDGVPIPRNTYSLGSYLTKDLSFYDRVEVLRGPAALLQGGDSPGGAMNLVRKRGQDKAAITLTGKAGSWDRYGLQLDAGGPLNAEGTLRARTVVSQTDNGSFIDYVRGWNQTVYGAVDYDFSPDLTVGIGVANQKGHSRSACRAMPTVATPTGPARPMSALTGTVPTTTRPACSSMPATGSTTTGG
ncbi:TonB-dependent siderophore receptor [Pseudomonas sp. NPDC089996]|uniref:TonB-dependent siderophore receptor n=1 Tax=Pseudomonas sp. NPDC089996 TaxID=3364474 RepID=UPI00380CF64F